MNDLDTADPNIQTAILEALAEGMSAAVLLYDRNDLVVFASQQIANIMRVQPRLLVPGTRIRDLLAAMYDAGIRLVADTHNYRRALSREDWVAEQIAGLWKERSESLERPAPDRWLSVAKRRLPSGYGVCVIKDVSEQKRREEQWRVDTERVQVTEEVLDNLPFPISVKDRNSTFVAVNKANCDFLDLPADAILGHKGADINSKAFEDRLAPINQHVYETGEPIQLPERITRPDGSTALTIVHKYRIGKPGRYYLVTVKQDVSSIAAGAGADQSLQSNEWASGFVPIDMTREPVPASPVNTGPAIVGVKVLVVSRFADTSAQAIEILSWQGADVSAAADADEFTLFLQLAAEADVRIDLVVIDARMPAELTQVAEAYGVAALRVEEAHIGPNLPVLVAAELGKPFAELVLPAVDGQAFPSSSQSECIDVLVAEDNEVNQIVFSQIIEGLGYRYVLAVDGEEAVRLWRKHSPRLVLMDVTLPKLTGFEASAAIRALEDGTQPVPIIGVLPQAFDRDREACIEAGMNDVILKPISPEALDAVFQRFLAVAEDEVEAEAWPVS
ncbi:response regulator [Aliirhizobium smilacinae]|uniref:Response regulator n=1 Tax=Aliirhizobium smilacinae TaxID=1395944 RepID=A0A5C4XTF9_9HYPH|nr:response regulator [Rhizobium smilacinae]TNM65964.1 response regulator [Rhizobium smilacinae]